MGNNFKFLLTSHGKEHLRIILSLAMNNAPGGEAITYCVSKKYGLVLGWTDTEAKLGDETALQKLPFPLDLEGVIEFVWNWLKKAEYDEEPDHDGSNDRGFTVYNEDWGHVGHAWQAFVAILPEWIMYGK